MSQQVQKKNYERELISRFSMANPQLAISEIQDFERPDFICRSIDGICGVELADFIFDPESAHESLAAARDCRRLQKELIEGHRTRHLPPMNVVVFLRRKNILRDVQYRKLLVESLLDVIDRTGSTGWPPARIEGEAVGEWLYEQGVCSITLIGGPSVSQTLWSFPDSAWLPESQPGMLQSLIDKKNPKVSAYRANVAKIWLLITAGPLGLNSMIEPTGSVLNEPYRCAFDRIFLFRTLGRHTHELQVQPFVPVK